MRLIATLCLISAAVFCGYWFYSARMMSKLTAQIIADAPHLNATPQTVTGFPLNFRLRLEAPSWQGRTGGIRWQSPYLDLATPSYQPNQIEFTLASEQEIEIGIQTFVLSSSVARGEVTLERNSQLNLLMLQIQSLHIAPSLLLQGVADIDLLLTQDGSPDYRLEGSARDIEVAPSLRAQLDPDGILPQHISRFSVDAGIEYANPVMFGAPLPAFETLVLDQLYLEWGPLHLSLGGTLSHDAGNLDGEATLTASNWEPLHQLIVSSGWLAPDMAMMAGMLLASQSDPTTGEISLPLHIRGSKIFLGPLMLAELP